MSRTITTILLLFACTGITRAQQETAISFDLDHRSRLVYWDEGLFPVGGWEGLFSRHRTIVGATWTPLPELALRAALANEFFRWYRHVDAPDFTFDEIFFENLFLRWQPGTLPLMLTLGRQNMIFDEGFVMMDGGPLDGSRAIYFNAARLDLLPATGHTVTLFALRQPRQDDLLPVLEAADRALLEVPTDAAGLYYTHDTGGGRGSAYYLYTHEEQDDAYDDSFARKVFRHTIGGRYSRSLVDGWRVTAEGNVQFGTGHFRPGIAEQQQRAWSWYAYATWQAADHPALSVDAGMYQYSGGRYDAGEGTQGDQHFAPLFARWPKWSESFIYTLIPLRGGVATWSNLLAPFLRLTWRVPPPLTVHATLQHIRESHESGGEGKDIGTLLILQAQIDAGHGLTGHALLERMWLRPDDVTVTADSYLWARLELRYRLRT
ncbi:MAG: hypothetical protein RRA94_03420 [Bacteroidota bacterium]|nr:hypothetical protein [Bacteroidota bacterium]